VYGTLFVVVSIHPSCVEGWGKGEEGGDVLLEQDRAEASVEGTDTLILQHLAETTDETIGICRLGNETDTGGFKRAESNIGEELSESSGGEVHGGTVVGSSLVSEVVDGLLLEQLIASKLECALEEVSGGGRAKASCERANTLLCDHLPETTEETPVVCDGVELDSCLDAGGRWLSVEMFLSPQA
jgi:hypothetical protein